jgi:endoglucanase
MSDLQSFLKTLISLPGLSGHEGPVRRVIEQAWQPLVDLQSVSRLGSLHALKRGFGPEPRPNILLAAHMDAIGLMVTGQLEGLLRMIGIGGLDERVLPGQLVTVHGKKGDYPGVIVQPAGHLLPPKMGNGIASIEHLLVDVGLSPEEIKENIQVGDLISFAQEPMELGEGILAGHSLDNRASVAVITACLENLKGRQTSWDIWAVATVQEEVSLFGAFTSAFELRPSLAVAIDVTFASGPGSPETKTFPLGKGITLGWGPNIHPVLYRKFKELADRLEIPYKMEPLPTHSGTDAFGLQIAAEGTPTMVISIPLRYMHTPVEMVAMKDIERAGRLLAEFSAELTPEFSQELVWDA